jgi:hypothetical protein
MPPISVYSIFFVTPIYIDIYQICINVSLSDVHTHYTTPLRVVELYESVENSQWFDSLRRHSVIVFPIKITTKSSSKRV